MVTTLRERAERRVEHGWNCGWFYRRGCDCYGHDKARSLEAEFAAIRREALEECAKVVEGMVYGGTPADAALRNCAAAIRRLAEKP